MRKLEREEKRGLREGGEGRKGNAISEKCVHPQTELLIGALSADGKALNTSIIYQVGASQLKCIGRYIFELCLSAVLSDL